MCPHELTYILWKYCFAEGRTRFEHSPDST